MIKAGQKFTLDVPIAGDPAPTVQWSRGDEVFVVEQTKSGDFTNPLDRPFDKPFGAPGAPKQRCRILNYSDKTRLFIPSVHKADSGVYTLTLKSEAGEDRMDVNIKVIRNYYDYKI